MNGNMELLIYGSLFIAVLLGIEGLFMMAGGDPSARKAANRRMRLRQKGGTTSEVMVKLRRTDVLPDEEDEDGGFAPLRALDRLLMQAGVAISTGRMAAFMVAATLSLWAGLVFGLRANDIAAAPVALLAGVGAPVVMLVLRRKKRIKKFGEQLPDAVDMIVRSLRAGHPVSAAIKLVSEHMPDPIGSEMGLAVDEMTYGLDLRQALENLGRRVAAPEVDFLVVAIKIQHQSGGNLAEILAGLSTVIRDRMKMVRKIRAVSSEGRFSAWMISGMPFVVGLLVNLMSPDYFGSVVDDALFMPVMLGLGVLLSIGIFTIFRIVNFRF